jgi:hypothetical protein
VRGRRKCDGRGKAWALSSEVASDWDQCGNRGENLERAGYVEFIDVKYSMKTAQKLGDLRAFSVRQRTGRRSPSVSVEMKELCAMRIDF